MTIQWRVIAVLIGLLTIGGSITGAYFFGRHDGKVSCKATALVEYQKGVERNDDIAKDVRRLDTPALDRALSRWMRPSN